MSITDAEARKAHGSSEVVIKKRATVRESPQRDGVEREGDNALAADFVRIELELADTFCKLALESHSEEHERQHRFNARRAMDAALDALTKVHMKVKEKELEGIVTKIEETKALVESLEAGGSLRLTC
jgi:hypothetical protein